MDRKSMESVVSINVSMSNIWVTRCRR